MVRAILFDLGNVLVSFEERKEVIARIVRAHNGNVDAAASLFSKGDGEAPYEALDTGQMNAKKLWWAVCTKGRIKQRKLPFHIFVMLYAMYLKPLPESVEVAGELGQRYQLVAVSNGDFGSRFVVSLLKVNHGISFLRSFISSECGVRKPQLIDRACDVLLREHGIHREECIYIDDMYQYVVAAKKLGLQAIQYHGLKESPHQLRSRLWKAGVELACS